MARKTPTAEETTSEDTAKVETSTATETIEDTGDGAHSPTETGTDAETPSTGGIRSSITAPTEETTTEDTANADGSDETAKPTETTDADPADTTSDVYSSQEEADLASVETGKGTVIGDGETIQSYIGDGQDQPVQPSGYGTTPVAPKPSTANELVAGVATPARVEKAVAEVIAEFAPNADDKPVTAMMNLFDDLGMARGDLGAFANKLNEEFSTTLTLSEAQNFLLVRDVWNMMKRKLAVASALGRE